MLDKHDYVKYPSTDQSRLARAKARFLINGFYSEIFGTPIRYETPRSIRLKILEIENRLSVIRPKDIEQYRFLVRQCVAYERVCELLEVLDH